MNYQHSSPVKQKSDHASFLCPPPPLVTTSLSSSLNWAGSRRHWLCNGNFLYWYHPNKYLFLNSARLEKGCQDGDCENSPFAVPEGHPEGIIRFVFMISSNLQIKCSVPTSFCGNSYNDILMVRVLPVSQSVACFYVAVGSLIAIYSSIYGMIRY